MTHEEKLAAKRAYYQRNKEEIRMKQNEKRKRDRESINAKRRKYYAENKEKVLASNKASYERNKEARLESCKRWREENRDRKREMDAEYYQRNKEVIINRVKAYTKRNKEARAKYIKQYYNTEKGKIVAASTKQKRRGQLMSTEDGTVTTESLFALLEQQNNKCYHCGEELDHDTPRAVHLDHLIPLSKGGHHTLSNVAWSCAYCNLTKNDKFLRD